MRVSLLLLSVVVMFSGTLDLFTRCAPLTGWLDRRKEESYRQTLNYVCHIVHFQLQEEQLLYEDLPAMDFSRGGVGFFGASEVEFSTMFWKLPQDIQSLVHNFGMPACNQESELVWLRFLIEQRGYLQAGGDKNLIVLGTTYHTAFYPCREVTPPFADALERHGLFVCDARQGIRPLRSNPIAKLIDFEETRQGVCMVKLRDAVVQQLSRWRHGGAEPSRTHDPAIYAQWRRSEMGADWKEKIDGSVAVLRETIDYLLARNARIRIVLMPLGSWENGLPYAAEYRRQVNSLCAEYQIPLSDWSGLLADGDFADSAHPDIFGIEKIQPAFLDFAIPFLRSTHAYQVELSR